MAGAYNPPNPYGSYFAFGQPESMTGQMYGPMPHGQLTPGAMAMAGFGSGGMNPTSMEYLSGKVREQYQQQFLASMMRNDPRVNNITNALMANMSASQQKSFTNVFGGRGNFQELVGWAMSQPGVSSMVGGSPLALGQGSYAAASGGMKVNGMGVFGDGPMNIMGAQAIANHMTRQFYFQGGGANTAATSGLNRDQIGGIMMLGASQGAFSGMNLGTLTAQGNKMNLNMDQATMTKISQFTKTAAKALSSLIDIYGDASIAELAAKANQITGLNFNQIGNAQIIQNRLSSLRQTAMATGMDTGTMFDIAAYGTQMGQSMGMNARFAGNVGVASAQRAAEVFRSNQTQAGSFLTATTSMQEIAGGLVRDQAAMARDPVGRRRMAMTLAMDTGHFKGAEAEARALIREDGPGAMGRMDMFMRSHGLDMDSYTRMMGGPEGIQRMLSEGSMDEIRTTNAATVNTRAKRVFRLQAHKAFGGRMDGAGGNAMMGLIEGLGKDTLEKIFQATESGFNEDKVKQILGGDPAGRVNGSSYLGMVKSVVKEMGGNNAAAMHASLQQAISVNPFLKSNFTTTSGEMALAENRISAMKFTSDDRGLMRQGMFEGLMDRLGGTDPRSSFVRGMMYAPESFFGTKGGMYRPGVGEEFNLDRTRQTAKTMLAELSKDKDGQAALQKMGIAGMDAQSMTPAQLHELHMKMANPVEFAMAFNGFQVATVGEGVKAFTMFGKKSAINNMAAHGGDISAAHMLSKAFENDDSAATRNLSKLAKLMAAKPETADKAVGIMAANTFNIERLANMETKTLETIAKSSRGWTDATSSMLQSRFQQLEANPDISSSAATEKANIKSILDVFERVGASSREKGGSGTMTLKGSLEVVGNILQIKDGQLVTMDNKK